MSENPSLFSRVHGGFPALSRRQASDVLPETNGDVYTRLKPGQIRLLKLHPYKIEDETVIEENEDINKHIVKLADSPSQLEIDLLTVELDTAPSYVCISYTWGGNTQDSEVHTTDGKIVKVTGTAWNILKQTRPFSRVGPIYLWIDQICINQEDDVERLSQIAMMRTIYSKASSVCIMLSNKDATYDDLFEALYQMEIEPLTGYYGPQEPLDKYMSIDTLTTLAHVSVVYTVSKIANDPVFSRSWIYQEICHASRALLHGQRVVYDFDQFSALFTALLKVQSMHVDNQIMNGPGVQSLEMIVADRVDTRYQGGQKDWPVLQMQAQGLLHSSNDRDHVLALVSSLGQDQIDREFYSMPVSSIWTMTAGNMIEQSGNLNIFGALPGTRHRKELEEEGLPSWVPDWSRKRISIPMCWHDSTAFNAANGYSFTRAHDSAGEPVRYTETLITRGRQIDTIHSTANWSYGKVENCPNLLTYLDMEALAQTWTETARANGHPVLDADILQERMEAFLGLLEGQTASFQTASLFTDDRFPERPPQGIYHELWWMLFAHDQIMQGEKPPFFGGQPYEVATMYSYCRSDWKVAMAKFREWARICQGRMIVFGEKNAFGLVPASAEPGDVICVIHGSRVPMVLRRQDTRYYVVGQCYWHGWMHGEKVTWKEHEGDVFELI